MSLTLDAPAFTLEPLSPVLGVAVIGIDARRPLNEIARRAVYGAFVRYHVLCFRDQHLDTGQQIAFTAQFGALERHMARNRGTGDPLVNVVSNLGSDGKPSGKMSSTNWHSDKSFRPEPSLATVLHAQIMPPEGGNTCFADMAAAYEALTDAERAELDGVRVVHDFAASAARTGRRRRRRKSPTRRRARIRWCGRSPRPDGGRCSWASMPRISRDAPWRRAAPGWTR